MLKNLRIQYAELDANRDKTEEENIVMKENHIYQTDILTRLGKIEKRKKELIPPKERMCPSCTFSNKIDNKNCEICETQLIKSGGNAQYSKQQYKKLKSQYYKY
jgi:hypothetical protein